MTVFVYNRHDCANIEIQESSDIDHDEISPDIDHDEISTFLDTRHVSAPEPWRLSEYHMYAQSYSISCTLAVHLPLQQHVHFKRGLEEEALARSSERDTQLTAWFKLNQQEGTAPEIPNHFVFNQKLKK